MIDIRHFCMVGTAGVLGICTIGAAQARQGYVGISERHPAGSEAISPAALVASYDMSTRTSSRLLRDFGPHENDGEISGTTAVGGVVNDALRFSVATDRIHLPENASFAIDGPLTIALWVRVDELNLHQHILACDDKFALWITPQNRIRFSDTLGHGVDSVQPVEAGRWYSLIALFHGSYGNEVTRQSVRLYLNGKQIATRIVNRTAADPVRWVPGPLYTTDACYIGFESHQGNEVHQRLQFEGMIDELLIFARALSDSEVRAFAAAN